MVSVLQNTTALAASRQLGLTKLGLGRSIERLTTHKRINHASDDALGMMLGNTAEAAARSAWESAKGFQIAFFTAQARDSQLQEATDLCYRMAEIEGGGNEAVETEYSALQSAVNTITLGTNGAVGSSSFWLGRIEKERRFRASQMASAQSSANLAAINAESNFAISDAWLGADIGAEMANLTKYQIMMQAGISALNKANQSAQSVLSLFK